MLKPLNGFVVVAWPGIGQAGPAGQDRAARDVVPGSEAGLVYGRTVRGSVATVLDAGDFPHLQAGDQVVAIWRESDVRRIDGVDTQAIATRRVEHTTRRNERVRLVTASHPFGAVWRDDSWQAVGPRVVGELVEPEQTGVVLRVEQERSPMLRLEVDSSGDDAVPVGAVALVPADAPSRMEWTDAAGDWCSVLASDVCAVEQ